MINLNKLFDKSIIELRNDLNKEKSKSEITIDLSDNYYEYLEKISIENGISIEDLIIDLFHNMILENIEKPKDIVNVIDSATFITYTNEVLDSNENFLLVDSTNIDNKSILITNKQDLEIFNKDIKNEK